MLKTNATPLVHGERLWLALFVSLGMLPLACGGSATKHDGGDNGQSGSANNSMAGEHSTAGTTSIAGGGAGGTGEVDGGTGGGPRKTVCSSPEHDPATGLVKCAEGYSHRAVAVACGSGTVGGTGGEGGADGGSAGVGGSDSGDPDSLPRLPPDVQGNVVLCAEDPAVCDSFQYGYCRQYRLGMACYSGCVTDQDCGSGAVCLCDDPASPTGGRCHPSGCATDQDCQPGYNCASHHEACNDAVPYACQKPEDTCAVDTDCADEEGAELGFGQACRIQSDGHRACEPRSFCD